MSLITNTNTNTNTNNNKYSNSSLMNSPLHATTTSSSLYVKNNIKQLITLPFSLLSTDKNIKNLLHKVISKKIEGKCIVEGFVKPESTRLLQYSFGVVSGKNIQFDVLFECLICNPCENNNIQCIAKNITQAGIRAVSYDEPSPVVIYISRDHHNSNSYFLSINEGDNINIKVIGKRYELNDTYVSVIGELIEKKEKKRFKKNPRLIVIDDEKSPISDIDINDNM